MKWPLITCPVFLAVFLAAALLVMFKCNYPMYVWDEHEDVHSTAPAMHYLWLKLLAKNWTCHTVVHCSQNCTVSTRVPNSCDYSKRTIPQLEHTFVTANVSSCEMYILTVADSEEEWHAIVDVQAVAYNVAWYNIPWVFIFVTMCLIVAVVSFVEEFEHYRMKLAPKPKLTQGAQKGGEQCAAPQTAGVSDDGSQDGGSLESQD